MGFVDAGHAIEQALQRPQQRIQKRPLAIEHPRHEHAQRLGDRKNEREKQQNLEPAIGCHQNFSGRNSAYSR